MASFEEWAQAYLDYDDTFGSIIRHHMPDGPAYVEDPETGKKYAIPDGETLEQFCDRIRRSKECGRNLFFEEWDPYTFEYKPGLIY